MKAKNALLKESKWKIGYYSATYVLAVIAISGFIYSIITSQSTTNVLDNMQQELAFSNEPLVKIDNCGWFKEGEISCDNPPVGVYVDCRNFSNVPVQVRETDARFFYGEKEFTDAVRKVGGEASSHILPPGEKFKVGTIQKELFQKYLGDKKSILVSPFLRVKLEVLFSRLGSTELYIYKSTQEIGFDCSKPDVWQMYPVEEQISRVTD